MADVSDRMEGSAGGEQSAAGEVKEKLQGGMQEAKEQVQEGAQQAKAQARSRVREQLDQRSTQAGEQTRSVAEAIRRAGEHLRAQGSDGPARMADQAAERTERLGGYLADSDAERILNDVEGFARRRPWAVAFGGAVVGFVASRLLKASSAERYEASFGTAYGGDGRAGGYVSPAERDLPSPASPAEGTPMAPYPSVPADL